MKIRALLSLIVLTALFALSGGRVYMLGAESVNAAYSGGAKTVDFATARGTVYERNLRPLTNSDIVYTAAARPTRAAAFELGKVLLYDEFKSVSERMSAGYPVTVSVNSAACQCRDIRIIATPKRYSGTFACHLTGYLDSEGRGISGIEKAYDSLLALNSCTFGARFACDALGRVLLGEEIGVVCSGDYRGGIALTVDKDIQLITEKALDEAEVACGAAVVIEIGSGEIIAAVSRPAFEPENIAESLADPDSPLINRAFLPFSVGSVFKPVVACAALENGVDSFEYECTGNVTLNGVTFNCHKEDGHGRVDMKQAVTDSCNTYFIALAQKIGAESIINTAEKFGFGKAVNLAPSMSSSGGNLPKSEELDSKAALANISFGQGALTATPLQICAMTAAIARGGVYISPTLIRGEVDAEGRLINEKKPSALIRAVSAKNAETVKGFLESVVKNGSGKRAASTVVDAAGKTATAQTGKTQGGEEIYNAWFSGYFPAENPRYAVTVLVENGGEGALSCAPIFRAIAESVTKLSE